MLEILKASYRLGAGSSDFLVKKIWYLQQEVFVCEDFFLAQGLKKGLGAAVLLNPEFIMVVNEEFMKAPQFIQGPIVEHERAHHTLGHCRGSKAVRIIRNILRTFLGSSEEFAADAHAAKLVGAYALINSLEYVRKDRTGASRRELDRRIRALEKL
jgi:hypothetical protein